MAGHGFGPSSSGEYLPAFSSDAHGPSVSFAPSVSMCKASSMISRPAPEVLPALGMAPSLPDESSAPSAPGQGAATGRTTASCLPSSDGPLPFAVTCYPSGGSFMHMLVHDGPVSPSSPFDHLNVGQDVTMPALLPDSLLGPCSFGSVHRVVTCPRVLGFWGDGWSYAHINLTVVATSASPGCLIDGGAYICITGDIDSLFDVVETPPLTISVAVEGDLSIDDCCTARSRTPLQLDDGLIYWQDCYY
jgi:hypothetical protein